jgi:hypothetical protein
MKHAVEQVVDGGDTCIYLGDNKFIRPSTPGHHTVYRVRRITKYIYDRRIQGGYIK